MRLADLPGRPCPIASSLELVGGRWSLLVVRELSLGVHRFNDIAAGTGAPRDRLAARLRALVEAGVVERRPYQNSPPRCEYHLTESGRALTPVLDALLTWGRDWAVDTDRAPASHSPVDGAAATVSNPAPDGAAHAHSHSSGKPCPRSA